MNFVSTHRKSYESKLEYATRLEYFSKNLEIISHHNSLPGKSYKMGINHLSDWSDEEVKSLNTLRISPPPAVNHRVPIVNAPDRFDWRHEGAVTRVKDQGKCGSCWAFSTIAQFEGAHKVSYGRLRQFSEQHLVDCNIVKGRNEGCDGGFMDTALEFLSENSAIYEEDYPYKAKDGECLQDYIDKPDMFVETDYMTGQPKIYRTVNGTKDELRSAIINVPVSVAIQADKAPFRNY